jgi:hypothetical protein
MVTDMNIFKHIYIYNEICKKISLYVNIHTIIYRPCIYLFILKNQNFKKHNQYVQKIVYRYVRS